MKTNGIKKLSLEIEGRGDMRDYKFKQLMRNGKYCLYEAKDEESGATHYEVFKVRVFKPENREMYPSADSFGYGAYNYSKKENSIKKFEEISS